MPTSEGDIYIDGELRRSAKSTTFPSVFQEPTCFPRRTVRETRRLRHGNQAVGQEAHRRQARRHPSPRRARGHRRTLHLIRFPPAWRQAHRRGPRLRRAEPEQLLMIDEPYGQLDIKLRFYLEDELVKLWKALGSTVPFRHPQQSKRRSTVAERRPRPRQRQAHRRQEGDRRRYCPARGTRVSDDFIRIRKQVTELIRWW